MKLPGSRPLRLAVCALIVLGTAAGFSAQAADKPAKNKKPAVRIEKQKPAKTKKVMVTGSRILREVPADATSADTEMNLVIIEEQKIRSTGTSNLRDALRKQPGTK